MSEPIAWGVAPAETPARPAPECQSLAEVRAAIDGIDRRILAVLRERLDYVRAAARFKRDADQVRAPDRVAAMLAQRRAWAEQIDLDPDWVEEVYRFLVDGFIRMEMRTVSSQSPDSSGHEGS